MMESGNVYRIGIDVGSTTLKVIVLDADNEIIYKKYRRHKADFNKIFIQELAYLASVYSESAFTIALTGSAGMGIAERTGVSFIQEVVASIQVIKEKYPDTHTMIDVGGEDVKMVFFEEGRQPSIHMNGSCAGGTGAFIDQMADLMNISLDELALHALNYEKIYPVASRCGVFAKTDVQNLLSRNTPVADICMSILHSVALQSITTLARGFEIKPRILCTGGPLTFIPALGNAFRKQLKVGEADMLLPENSEFFPAWGAALLNEDKKQDLIKLIRRLQTKVMVRKNTLPALFANETEYQEWKRNRKIKQLTHIELGSNQKSDLFLGIDSGSTTTKILIMDDDMNIVYSFYDSNQGNPLNKVVEGLKVFYKEAAEKEVPFRFVSSAVTGYGEELIRSALNLDYGIIETMAHLSGAQYVDPEVSFVLDIGGQDMKSIFTRDSVISNVELNEACSSGCGSFLQNFAATMNLSLDEFSRSACMSAYPYDLGSRCTVFMNSKVKQALRENAGLEDIAAGLAYSVVKNCLFKVLKISNLNQLGEHIVVQGGTFRNESVYRALELLSGKSVSSTDRPELMGALGAALYAHKMWKQKEKETLFTGAEKLPDVSSIDTRELQCKGCTNKCAVLRFRFDNGNISYTGNKCEKVFFSKTTVSEKGYNAFDRKNELLFERNKEKKQATGISIGIPRVLNLYENYPFWHALFTGCNMRVVLSPESTTALYQKGVGYVMSDNICFPAKLVHGHILALAESGVDRIFYPMVTLERKEFESSNNSYNCPVVSGYPDVVRSSMEPEEKLGIPFDKPVITFSDTKKLAKTCYVYFRTLGVSEAVFYKAFKEAIRELVKTERIICDQQKELFHEMIASKKPVFVVAGRPYHTDPLINQKVGQILSDLGVNVFTDDVFRRENDGGFGALDIVSQWSYPNRVIQAAMEVAALPQNVQLVQLNSFGCGPDSFFMDETTEILRQAGKNHTLLRIDEIASPGSVRLRMRSLVESLGVSQQKTSVSLGNFQGYKSRYTEADRRKTILAPWFSDFISPFIPVIGELAGYRIVNLPKTNKDSAEIGLIYGNNEVCYPATLVLGDIIKALQSGMYDPSDVVVAITQTGGQCRATNYLSQIKNGLTKAGFTDIPVLVISSGEVFQNDQKAFRVPLRKMLNILTYGLLYADALQQMYSATIVREVNAGDTQKLFDSYVDQGIEFIRTKDNKGLVRLLVQAVNEFNEVKTYNHDYKKIGLVGEIYVKYNSYGQARITEWLRSQQMEVVTPPILDFVLQYFVNSGVNSRNKVKERGLLNRIVDPLFYHYLNQRIKEVDEVMQTFRYYKAAESIFVKAEYAAEILDLSNQFGEGWMIAAEVACFARSEVNRVVCVQPFGCIANHIVAKGIEKRLKKFYPEMNLLYLDIDGGIAEVNLQNRLHFLISDESPALGRKQVRKKGSIAELLVQY